MEAYLEDLRAQLLYEDMNDQHGEEANATENKAKVHDLKSGLIRDRTLANRIAQLQADDPAMLQIVTRGADHTPYISTALDQSEVRYRLSGLQFNILSLKFQNAFVRGALSSWLDVAGIADGSLNRFCKWAEQLTLGYGLRLVLNEMRDKSVDPIECGMRLWLGLWNAWRVHTFEEMPLFAGIASAISECEKTIGALQEKGNKSRATLTQRRNWMTRFQSVQHEPGINFLRAIWLPNHLQSVELTSAA